jgi:hypothetical protein
MEPTPGGTILKAEDAKSGTLKTKSTLPGFTGNGYLEYNEQGKSIDNYTRKYEF